MPLALYTMYLAPVLAIVQNAVPAAQRSTASAILLLIINLIGLGGGPRYVGLVSDAAGAATGLRTAMFALAPLFLLAMLAHLLLARALARPR